MKKSILVAFALALSGSALAGDVQDFVSALTLTSQPDDSGTLCTLIKATYRPESIVCIKVNLPLFMVKQSIDVFQSIYKSAKLTNSILYKYSFQDTEFTVRPGDFYQKDIANNLVGSDFKLIRVILDSTSKYTTSLVFY